MLCYKAVLGSDLFSVHPHRGYPGPLQCEIKMLSFKIRLFLKRKAHSFLIPGIALKFINFCQEIGLSCSVGLPFFGIRSRPRKGYYVPQISLFKMLFYSLFFFIEPESPFARKIDFCTHTPAFPSAKRKTFAP